MTERPTFEEYVTSLGRLTAHVDPTAASSFAAELKEAARSLTLLTEVNERTLADWTRDHPAWAPVHGLAVGLSQEKLKNTLKHELGSAGWNTLARNRPDELIEMLDREFDLIRLVTVQRDRAYDFGDILVARAGTRSTAGSAGASGRRVELEIEAIATDLGLPHVARARFVGRNERTAPLRPRHPQRRAGRGCCRCERLRFHGLQTLGCRPGD